MVQIIQIDSVCASLRIHLISVEITVFKFQSPRLRISQFCRNSLNNSSQRVSLKWKTYKKKKAIQSKNYINIFRNRMKNRKFSIVVWTSCEHFIDEFSQNTWAKKIFHSLLNMFSDVSKIMSFPPLRNR